MRRFFSGSKQIASTDAKVVKDVTRELARLAFTPLCLAPPFYDQISTLLQLNPQTDVIQKAQIVLTKFTRCGSRRGAVGRSLNSGAARGASTDSATTSSTRRDASNASCAASDARAGGC